MRRFQGRQARATRPDRGRTPARSIQNGVFAAASNQHADNRQRAVVVAVHQVHFHVERIPRNRVFAGRVEVELDQFVARALDLDPVLVRGCHLDGVAVVDDRHRHRPIAEDQARRGRRRGVREIDRGLALAQRAEGVLPAQLAPDLGTVVGTVPPMGQSRIGPLLHRATIHGFSIGSKARLPYAMSKTRQLQDTLPDAARARAEAAGATGRVGCGISTGR